MRERSLRSFVVKRLNLSHSLPDMKPIATPRRSASSHHVRTTSQLRLAFEAVSPKAQAFGPCAGARAIEDEDFPFEWLSAIAESESWRKEINRPLSHIHKWWAQRLGSVFRGVTLGALAPSGSDIKELYYSRARFPGATVFDPFMGSGTTLIEAVKLGARAIGRDINPVAYFLVRNALAVHRRDAVMATFAAIEQDVADRLQRFYQAHLPDGQTVPVLYYFWVKQMPCPSCDTAVDLFSSRVFAQHAYAKRNPEARAVCPHCGEINRVRFDATAAECTACQRSFDPSTGPARGQHATCPCCAHTFGIAKTVRATNHPPEHRLYAKLVLLPDGRKEYLPADAHDEELYRKAEAELSSSSDPYPRVEIEPGYNTNQALNYNYRFWHQFFNARQLLGLSILAERIRGINEPALRDLFTCLFSGALEFNNMFASYKGEGTGAVRHMFSHHILKPERVPLEANLWGTPKSSGSFSTMFKGRILRALDYADSPFEQRVVPEGKAEKVYGLSDPIGFNGATNFADFAGGKQVYVSCGSSGSTDLADGSVDAVLTDPPFFDNVHYSQLADFFHVWQRHILGAEGCWSAPTTRADQEVQHSEESAFRDRLGAVWRECHRVLKDDGLLVFSYHHSRTEGWRSILEALMEAGFGIVAAHPVKAEMSGAAPKQQAKEPIDLDILVVCRKLATLERCSWDGDLWAKITPTIVRQVERLRASGRRLSRNDVRIIVMAQLLRPLSVTASLTEALTLLEANASQVEPVIDRLHLANKTN